MVELKKKLNPLNDIAMSRQTITFHKYSKNYCIHLISDWQTNRPRNMPKKGGGNAARL